MFRFIRIVVSKNLSMTAYVVLDGKRVRSNVNVYLLLFYNLCCTKTVKYARGLVKVFVYETLNC